MPRSVDPSCPVGDPGAGRREPVAGRGPRPRPQRPPPAAALAQASAPAAATKLVDINKASRTELKTLPGIGDAEAAKIIGARPYMTKTDLVTKNVLTLAGLRCPAQQHRRRAQGPATQAQVMSRRAVAEQRT